MTRPRKGDQSLGGLPVQRLDLYLVALVSGQAGVRAGGRPIRPDQHCIKVSLITLVLQYRFATPKFLKTHSAPDRCKTVPFCNPSWCEPAAKILAGAWVLAQAEQDPDTANCKPC